MNPFRERICKVFSEDNSGDMSFEDFLDMMSVFSEGATRDVKASYAFRIYGKGYTFFFSPWIWVLFSGSSIGDGGTER